MRVVTFVASAAIASAAMDGRLRQVEYAMRAAERGSLVVAVEASDGAVIAAVIEDAGAATNVKDDRDVKICKLAPNLALGTAGMMGDARHMASCGRLAAVEHWFRYGERPNALGVARALADHALAFSGTSLNSDETTYRTARPVGLAALVAGVDRDGASAVYAVSPGGDFRRWRAAAIGRGSRAAEALLEDEITHDPLTLDRALRVVVKILRNDAKDDGRPPPSPASLRFVVVRRPATTTVSSTAFASDTFDDGWATPDAPAYHVLASDDVAALLSDVDDDDAADQSPSNDEGDLVL